MSTITGTFDLSLVALSYGISVIGAFAALLLAEYIPGRNSRVNGLWLTLAAIVLGGCGVWAMHFVGMVAYETAMPVTYATDLTLLSLLAPIAGTALALFTVFHWRKSPLAVAGGSVMMGGAIATMHYVGMAAMRMPADISYSMPLVALSIAIAVAASAAGLFIMANSRGAMRYLTAPVIGVAVCGMHYTGMLAMTMTANGTAVDYFAGALTSQMMLAVVSFTAFTTCVGGIALALFESSRRLTERTAFDMQ